MSFVRSAASAACGLLLILGTSSHLATAASDPAFASTWPEPGLTVDGTLRDWPELGRLDRGPSIGFRNDSNTLIVAVTTSDPELRRQLSTGLILWLDASGKRTFDFGVRVPGPFRRALPGANPDGPAPDSASSTTRLDQFDVVGPGRNARRLVDLDPSLGVEVATGLDQGAIVYEVRLPLQKSPGHPYAAGVAPGATITVGLETPELPRIRDGRDRESGSGSSFGGGIGGMQGMGGSGMPQGGSSRRQNDDPPKPFKLVWMTAKLASAPAALP
jgi:hypothetical protein